MIIVKMLCRACKRIWETDDTDWLLEPKGNVTYRAECDQCDNMHFPSEISLPWLAKLIGEVGRANPNAVQDNLWSTVFVATDGDGKFLGVDGDESELRDNALGESGSEPYIRAYRVVLYSATVGLPPYAIPTPN